MKRLSNSSARRLLRVRPLILALCGAGCVSASLAQGVVMPVVQGEFRGETVVAPVVGTATREIIGGDTANPVHNFNQTSTLAVWHFSSFNIGAGGRVDNQAAKTSDVTVFRVMGADSSQLFGPITANNRLFLINRNGIHSHEGAKFSGAGSLVMSAQDLDPGLIADNYAALQKNPTYIRFVSNAGQFINNDPYGGYGSYGDATVDIDPGVTMVAGDGGSIILVGDHVRNQGTLRANGGGSVGLVAAGTAEMQMQMNVGDSGFIRLVSFDKLPAESFDSSVGRVAVNTGTIEAQDGTVILGQANLAEVGNDGAITPAPAVVASVFGSEYSPNGVYNTGSIEAKGVNGGQGTVTLEAKGYDNAAVNSGSIDVSASNGASLAGTIRMSGARVLHGGSSSESVAELLADGPKGGSITLDNRTAPRDGETSSLIQTNQFSLISAKATAGGNGDGGQVTMSTATSISGTSVAGLDHFGRIIVRGAIDAQGNGSGKGGTLTTVAPSVSVREGEQVARIQLGAGGLWRLVSNNIAIGSSFFSGEGGFGGTVIHPDDINSVLDGSTNVTMQAQHSGAEGSVFEEGFLDIEPGADIHRNTGNGGTTLTLESTNDLFVGAGVEIDSSAGPLNVTLNADSDKAGLTPDGRGSLIIGGEVIVPQLSPQLEMQAMLTDGAVPLAVAPGATGVLIDTNGGNLVLSGTGQPPANQSESGLTNAAGVSITNAQFNAGQGTVTITGAGGSTSGDAISQNGVSIANAEIAGSGVSITGDSTSATGVSITNTNIDATTGPITVIGKSEGGGDVGQHIGVDIQDNVVFNTGAGGAKIHGLAVGGFDPAVGLRIKSLTITTSTIAPSITLVGQSMLSSGPGLQVLSDGDGLILEGLRDPENPGAARSSTADLIIGASADAAAPDALLLGNVAPQLNTTGRVNIRPMSMEINNPAQASPLNAQAIRIKADNGAANAAINFNIDRRWLGLPAAGGTAPPAKYVIGSNTHTGLITADAGALNNAGIVSLQNQGANSLGIALGAQFGIRQLNLLSAGPISQSGALGVGVLNIKAADNADVDLSNPGNQFGVLNFDGAETPLNVTPAATTNSGAEGIVGMDTTDEEGPVFQNLSISAVTNNDGDRIEPPDVDRSFEGTDLMNELRTDVYVHGQLSRPQLCTPANTSGGVSPINDGGADTLALEWVKVRRGPQLTNCAGMRADSNCSAF